MELYVVCMHAYLCHARELPGKRAEKKARFARRLGIDSWTTSSPDAPTSFMYWVSHYWLWTWIWDSFTLTTPDTICCIALRVCISRYAKIPVPTGDRGAHASVSVWCLLCAKQRVVKLTRCLFFGVCGLLFALCVWLVVGFVVWFVV